MSANTGHDEIVDYSPDLDNKLQITRLRVDFDDTPEFPPDIGDFANLKELRIIECPESFTVPDTVSGLQQLETLSFSADGDRTSIPEVFYGLPIKHLHVHDVPVGQVCRFANLERLFFVVENTEQDVRQIAERFPGIRHLEIWGAHMEEGSLPAEIGQLSQLEELDLVSCGLRDLPDEFGQLENLRILRMRGIPMTRMPAVIGKLKSLETLQSQAHVSEFPPEFAQLKSLKHLDVGWALNKGTMNAPDYDMETCKRRYKPIPSVFGELENLESLNLDCCGVWSVEPLESLRNLKKLDLMYSGLEDCEGLARLESLEDLSIKTSYKIRDITPLKALALKKLKIESLYVKDINVILEIPTLEMLNIEGCSRIKDFTPIYEHPNLKELEADDEVQSKWQQAEIMRKLPEKTEINRLLASSDLAEVERGIGFFTTWTDFNSTDDNNAVFTWFAAESDDEELTDIAQIDSMLEQHAERLSSGSLIKLFKSGLASINDNLSYTLTVVQELIRRQDGEAQAKAGNIFHDACSYYDGGHRFWGYTVHDQLIDDYFPQFTSQGLLPVLQRAAGDELNHEHGDALDLLFAPAFGGNPDAETEDALVEVYLEFYNDAHEYYEANYFSDMTADIVAVASERVKQKLGDLTEKTRRLARLNEGFVSEDSEEVEAAFRRIGKEIAPEEIELFDDSIRRALYKNTLDYDVLKHVFDVMTAGKIEAYWFDDLLKIMLLARPDDTEAVLADFLGGDVDEEYRASVISDIKTLLQQTHQDPETELDQNRLRQLLIRVTGQPESELRQEEYQRWFSYLLNNHYRMDDKEARYDNLIAGLNKYNMRLKVDRDRDSFALDSECQSAAKHGEPESVRHLFRLLPYLDMPGYLAESIATNLIISAIALGDDELFRVIEGLLPEELENETLTFNLSCYWALKKDKPNTMKYAQMSLELGKPKESFLVDEDFSYFRNDQEFQTLVSAYE